MYAKLVANVQYFAKCHESLVSDIVMIMHPCSVLKNEFVYVQHEIAAHVFFLLKGEICVSRTLPGAKGDVKIGAHTVGEHFGEVWRCCDQLSLFSARSIPDACCHNVRRWKCTTTTTATVFACALQSPIRSASSHSCPASRS